MVHDVDITSVGVVDEFLVDIERQDVAALAVEGVLLRVECGNRPRLWKVNCIMAQAASDLMMVV